ncbi:MAG: hypothetical protein KGI06_04195 [Candidatus Micrarchaeota archaeon]|nr:hypothetical protein [Candidatus Micrarchaeota archaeon]
MQESKVGEHAASPKRQQKRFNMEDCARHALAFALYLVIALVMFYPIALHMGTYAPGTGADTYQNLWDIWWVKYAVFNLHTNVFYTKMIFWPIGANLAYLTLTPLLGIISAPLQAIGTVFAYNVMFLLGFALSGLTMYVLADYLTSNRYAAVVSGFVFAFSAFHIAQSYSHIHFMNIEWIPLFVYFLIRTIKDDRKWAKWTNIAGMSATFALTTLMGNIEETIMLTFALVLILAIYLSYSDTRKRMLSIGFVASMIAFLALAFAIGSWNFIPLIGAVSHSGGLGVANYLNNFTTNVQWSVKPAALFIPSYYNGIVYSSGVPSSINNWLYAPDPVEKIGYIGYVVLALMAFAIYKYKRDMLPWALGAAIFIWLALGPQFGLYQLYHALPGINVVREPGRFDLIATLFIAILAAYGSKAVLEAFAGTDKKAGAKAAYMIVAILIVVMFMENNGMPLYKSPYYITHVTVPPLYYQLSNLTSNFSVLGLPALPAGNNPNLYPGEDTYYTSVSHKPLVGGYSGRPNLTSSLLLYNIPLTVQTSYLITNGTGTYPSPVNQNYTNQTLLSLFNYNTDFVILHKNAFTQQEGLALASYMYSVFGNAIYNDNTTMAFETLHAINNSIFKSYVAYPILLDWSSTNIFLNGSYQTFWIPSRGASIAVYAPYTSSVPLSAINPYSISYINTTISFVAFSNAQQTLSIDQPSSANSVTAAATMSISTKPQRYTTHVTFVSGPIGNLVYFVQSGSSPVLINNITFSRG